MASNGNKYKNRVQLEHYVMWIQLGIATMKIQPKFGLCKFFIAGFKYFAFISIRKEAINKIKIGLRSRNDALSSNKNFLLGNWLHANVNLLKWSYDRVAAPLLKLIFKKVVAPLLKLIWLPKISHTYINKTLKKQPLLVLPFAKGKQQSSFHYLKAICDWMGCIFCSRSDDALSLELRSQPLSCPSTNIQFTP